MNWLDSNGSGVTVLLELVRIFSRIYSNPKTRPPTNLVFLLSAAGKWNYYGTKRWLEDQVQADVGIFISTNKTIVWVIKTWFFFAKGSNSELLADVSFVACLDSIGGGRNNNSQLYLHVSKPHKDDTPAGKFFNNLKSIASEVFLIFDFGASKLFIVMNTFLCWTSYDSSQPLRRTDHLYPLKQEVHHKI